eukprot:5241376-Pyramimonas_sp.AAC.1
MGAERDVHNMGHKSPPAQRDNLLRASRVPMAGPVMASIHTASASATVRKLPRVGPLRARL